MPHEKNRVENRDLAQGAFRSGDWKLLVNVWCSGYYSHDPDVIQVGRRELSYVSYRHLLFFFCLVLLRRLCYALMIICTLLVFTSSARLSSFFSPRILRRSYVSPPVFFFLLLVYTVRCGDDGRVLKTLDCTIDLHDRSGVLWVV